MIEEEAMQNDEIHSREWIDSGTIPPPKKEHIAAWTFAALRSISTQTVKNAWCHRVFSWFPDDAEDVSNHYINDKIMLALPCMPFMAMIKALV